jgi:hypothetical protein
MTTLDQHRLVVAVEVLALIAVLAVTAWLVAIAS